MVKPPAPGDNHSSPSGVEIKKELRGGTIRHILHGAHRNNFISTLNIACVLKLIFFSLSEPACRYTNSVILGFDAAFLDSKFLTMRRNILPVSSRF
jgi:hypothetical protein